IRKHNAKVVHRLRIAIISSLAVPGERFGERALFIQETAQLIHQARIIGPRCRRFSAGWDSLSWVEQFPSNSGNSAAARSIVWICRPAIALLNRRGLLLAGPGR